MSPTLKDGDKIISLKTTDVKKEDIIVFTNPAKFLQISRVVGVPGETIENTTLSDNEYYVICDNRNQSLDSREFGPINKDDIVGKMVWKSNK